MSESGIKSEIGGSVDLRAMRRLAQGDNFLIGHVAGLMHPEVVGHFTTRTGRRSKRVYRSALLSTLENATLAKWLHDGTSTIVARPYLTQGIRDGWERIHKAMRLYLKAKIENPARANAARVGASAVGAVQEFVRSGYYKTHLPNAPGTRDRKGSDTPLIDTAFLINSVTYVAKPAEPPKGWPTTNAVEARA